MGIRFRNIDEQLVPLAIAAVDGVEELDIGPESTTVPNTPFYAPFTGVVVKAKLRVGVSLATGGGPANANFINASDSDADITELASPTIAHNDALGTLYEFDGNGVQFNEGDHLKIDILATALTGGAQVLTGHMLIRRVGNKEDW